MRWGYFADLDISGYQEACWAGGISRKPLVDGVIVMHMAGGIADCVNKLLVVNYARR